MTRFHVAAALCAAIIVPFAATAPAGAYVHQADCQNALVGREFFPDNDIAIMGNYFWGDSWTFDGWMYFNRRNGDEVRQDAGYRTGTTGRVRLMFVCRDGDRNGAIQSGEDFYVGWGGQY